MKKYLAIIALSCIAFINALYLTDRAYYLKETPISERPLSFCDINSTFSCTNVLESPYSEVFGVPFPAIALFVYPILALLAFLGYRNASSKYFKPLLILALMGVAFNGTIIYREAVYIGAFCYLCLICSAIIVTIAILSAIGTCEKKKTA